MKSSYKGILLENLEKDVSFSHSQVLCAISGGQVEMDQNTDYTEKLLSLDKTTLSEKQFYDISALNAVVLMNYQICNGGIGQYYYNGYDKYQEPFHDQDVARLDKNAQIIMLKELLDFGETLYKERQKENEGLRAVISQFESIYLENEEVYEMVYSEDDALIFDEEIKDWVDNPAYEEPYEIYVGNEDVLKNAKHFDDSYYEVNDYLETLCEGYAQFLFKAIEKEHEKVPIDELIETVKEQPSKSVPSVSRKEPQR